MSLQQAAPAPVRRIGIVGNLGKPAAVGVAQDALDAIGERITISVQHHFAAMLGRSELGVSDEEMQTCDAVLVFGGDGTVLGTSRLVAPFGTPMLGVNLGRFGFLNEVAPERVASAVEHLIAGDYMIEERLMLQADVLRDGEVIASDVALNEVVAGHATLARVMHLSMMINGEYVTTYAADGIILATPTGSTAYSLSAGGPLVHPELDVVLITPICPHTLTTRALIMPPSHEVQLQPDRSDLEQLRVTVDGQRNLPIAPSDVLRVKRAPFPARLITRVGGSTFYDKLQTKLRWGERVAY